MGRKPDVDFAAVNALLHKVFGTSVSFQRTPDGVSTQVYRIRRAAQTFYLRIAEEAGENLETDAELHRRLRGLGVQVADVIHVEPFNPDIGRSTLITTEVPGVPVAEITSPAAAIAVVESAGADLAVLNQVPVDGFGWVQRLGCRWPLQAEHPVYPPFLTSHLPSPWPGQLASLFTTPILEVMEDVIEQGRRRPPARALLAHGDFDLTHIFCAGGRYSGLIDFGEIRGAERFFDLGHFLLYDRDARIPALLKGYQRVQALPDDHEQAIRRSAILLALRQLCRWLGPSHGRPVDHPAVTSRARRIAQLCGGPQAGRAKATTA